MTLNEHLERFGMTTFTIDSSLRILGQKYALHILRNMLLLNQNKFGEFLESISGINSKTLSIRLRQLEDSGLIVRNVLTDRPVHTKYYLTEKGTSLRPLLEDIVNFSMR